VTATQRILVVDDEAPLLMTLVANLELEGFDVMEAHSAERALELAGQHQFDMVLSDVRMPGMSGVDLCHELHRRHPGLPVILMTAFTVEGVLRDAVDQGALMVLPKPFAVEHLLRALHGAMHRPVILVIDDSVEVADSTAAALQAVGLPARAVHDGAQAIEAFQAGDIGVCVVDMVMPGLSGPDVIDRLRAIDPSVVVIAMSGYDVEELFRRVAGQADRIMRKPVDPHELLQAIAAARVRRSARAPG
jgi:DNA-binding NtrC family response regulator